MSDGSTQPGPRIANGVASLAPEGVAAPWTVPAGAPVGEAPPFAPFPGGELDFSETFPPPSSKVAPLSGRLTRKRTEGLRNTLAHGPARERQGVAHLCPAAVPARRGAFRGAVSAARRECRREPRWVAGLVSPSALRPSLLERRALRGHLQEPPLSAAQADTQALFELDGQAAEAVSGSLAHA